MIVMEFPVKWKMHLLRTPMDLIKNEIENANYSQNI